MRPHFSATALISGALPSRVGTAALAGRIKSGFAPSDLAFFDGDLPLPEGTRLELRGAGSGAPAALETAPAIDPFTAPPSADAGGPSVVARLPAVEPGGWPARSSRAAAESTVGSSSGPCGALCFAFAARTAEPRVSGYKSITSCGGFASR